MIRGVEGGTQSSCSRLVIHLISATVLATARYFASIEDHEIAFCFLEDHEIGELPKYTTHPVVEVRSVGSPAQSESE